MSILVTGGAGYIGSHTVLELLQSGYEAIVVDNLSNSKEKSLECVRELTGVNVNFIKADLLDIGTLNAVFSQYQIDAVIHFAGMKAVGESVQKPLLYYRNNVTGTLNLFESMKIAGVKNIVFSSSSTIYGNPERTPIIETDRTAPIHPYGRSKLMIEEILSDLYAVDSTWNVIVLRYFNPVGAHFSGKIGEDPIGIPNNLMPCISQIAVGRLKELCIYGNDYPTNDGTCVRDYIHVEDVAIGHVMALDKLRKNPGFSVYNLGTGHGYSVLEIVKAFEKISGKIIPYKIVERRPGDIACCFANAEKAFLELEWKAEKGLDQMCLDSWRWQSLNPDGYMS